MMLQLGGFTFVFCLAALSSNSQQTYNKANKEKINGIEKYAKAICDTITTTAIDRDKIKKDRENVVFLNAFFSRLFSVKQWVKEAKKNHLSQTKHRNLGLLQQRDYSFYDRSGYLYIAISITSIDDEIIRKNIYLETRSKLVCLAKQEPLTWLQDYLYIDSVLIGMIGFPFNTCATCPALIADSLYEDKLAALPLKYPGYKFPSINNPGDGMGKLTYASYILYDYQRADKLIVELLEQQAFDALHNLVFSPNYSIAINAYEALIYLEHKKVFSPDPETRAKMLTLKNSDTPITISCGPDCLDTKASYRSMNISTAAIVGKYENALAKQAGQNDSK